MQTITNVSRSTYLILFYARGRLCTDDRVTTSVRSLSRLAISRQPSCATWHISAINVPTSSLLRLWPVIYSTSRDISAAHATKSATTTIYRKVAATDSPIMELDDLRGLLYSGRSKSARVPKRKPCMTIYTVPQKCPHRDMFMK